MSEPYILSALLVTTKRRQWLTSLVSAQPTHKSGMTISTHTTPTQMTYLINKASHALSDMLWRQKSSWHRMKKTSRALHKILGLCNLLTPGLGKGTSLTLLLPLHTKRIHLYLLFFYFPRAIPLWDGLPTTWANSLSFSIITKIKKAHLYYGITQKMSQSLISWNQVKYYLYFLMINLKSIT